MRLFVGLPLPDDTRARIAGIAGSLPLGRRLAADNLHLTLVFLGDVAPAGLGGLDEALREVDAGPVRLEFGAALALGGRTARALALEARGAEALQARVLAAVRRAGFAPERRRFRGHVTFARLPRGLTPGDERRLAGWLADIATPLVLPASVDRFTLYRSHLSPAGAAYEGLADYPLAG